MRAGQIMTDVVNSPGQAGVSPSGIPAAPSAPASGSFRGERVEHVRNPTAQLQDAAEELTFSRSERAGKRLARRKLASRREQTAFAVDQARKYLERVPDLERSHKLSDFAKSILQHGGHPNPRALRQRAEEFSNDATHQFLALSFAQGVASAQNADPVTVDALDRAVGSLFEEKGPAIQAGLNISTVAQRHSGEELGTTQELRDLYRDVVLDCDDINDAFRRIVDGYPGRTFDEAVQFLLNALGTDLAASTHTVSRARLKQIINDMYQLKSLNSIHRQCEELLQRTEGNYGGGNGPIAARNLMAELLTAQSRAWQGADAFTNLPAKMGVAGDAGSIYLLNGFKELVRFLPLKAFGDDQSQRDRIMIAVQQALDLAIDNEAPDV